MKRFIKKAVKPLDIDSGRTRIGLVEYGALPSSKMKLSQSSKSLLSLLLDSVRPTRGRKDPLRALKFIKDNYFTPLNPRKDVKKRIVLLMTERIDRNRIPEFGKTLKSLNESDIGYVIVHIGDRSEDARMLKKSGDKYGRIVLLDVDDSLPEVIPDVVQKGKGMQSLLSFLFLVKLVSNRASRSRKWLKDRTEI